MKFLAILFALGGAAIGAVIWGMLAAYAGVESGWVAWGIGALVGVGAFLGKGKGQAMGIACAIIALGSIFFGKLMAVNIVFQEMIPDVVEMTTDNDAYEDMKKDAVAYKALGEPGSVGVSQQVQFMLDHDYANEKSASDVSSEAVEDFRTNDVPDLENLSSSEPRPFDEWHKRRVQIMTDRMNNMPLSDIVFKSLGFFDLIFGLFGIATAYRIGSQAEEA